MGRLLDSFTSTLPKTQARSVRKKLAREVNSGIITSAEEYRRRYNEVARGIIDQGGENFFNGWSVDHGERISSDGINETLALISLDLEALFGEMDHLLVEAKAQRKRNKEEIEGRLAHSLLEVETEIERISFLHKNLSGLSSCLAENFQSSSERLSRSDEMAPVLYRDPKLLEAIPPSEEMIAEAVNKGLILPARKRSYIETEISVQEGENIADGDRGLLPIHGSPSTLGLESETDPEIQLTDDEDTIWERRLITAGGLTAGAKLNLRIDLLGRQKINYLEINPANTDSQELSAIYCIDTAADSGAQSAQISFTPRAIAEPTRIQLKDRFATEIILVFTQKVSQPLLLGLVGWEFAFESIRTGVATYADRGFYASKTISGHNLTLFRLTTEENKTHSGLNAADLEQDLNNPTRGVTLGQLPPVEYFLHYRDLDAGGSVLFTKTLPLLPSGKQRAKEVLHLRPDRTATLSFHVRPVDDADTTTLRVYKNGLLLTRQTAAAPGDYRIKNPFGDNEVRGERQTIIELVGSTQEDGEFFADYSPYFLGAAERDYSTLDGTVRYNSDCSIEVIRAGSSGAERSEANLLVIVRNCGDKKATPIVNSYKLAVGERA